MEVSLLIIDLFQWKNTEKMVSINLTKYSCDSLSNMLLGYGLVAALQLVLEEI